MNTRTWKTTLLLAAVLACVAATYSNHFRNPFHFDDSHAVESNPYIRDLRNAPSFFRDARTFSSLPANRAYRPLVTLSLAVDYWLAGGFNPTYFQASTFGWYLVQLTAMFLLFRRIFLRVRPGVESEFVAAFAVAFYGLHPAMAETVNYVIQRGDVYSTLGVVAALAIYAEWPGARRYGFYLFPLAAALLSKPPALVFPVLLFAYLALLEQISPWTALRKCLPSAAVALAFAWLTAAMTPSGYVGGASSAFAYRLTQPLVALRYFRTFFLPDHLSADTDHRAVENIVQDNAWLGLLFVAALIAAAVWCSRQPRWRPVAFGFWWFLIALLPTSVFPLAEVENDHRLYFPFVGLAFGLSWAAANFLLERSRRSVLVAACLLVLAALAAGTRERNRVWGSEESLWYDVTLKSPRNGRGLMNYGLTQMEKGRNERALDYFERALEFTPAYYVLEINLGIANGQLRRDAAAEEHFLKAIALAPAEAGPHYYYGRWLRNRVRLRDAALQARQAVVLNPDLLDGQYLLLMALADLGDWPGVKEASGMLLARFPTDPTAKDYLARANAPQSTPPVVAGKTPEDYLNLSLAMHRGKRYRDSIEAAKAALRLRPGYAEAWNNIAAAYEELEQWDLAVDAARKAVALKPDFQLAKNNLAWAASQQAKAHK